LTVKIKDYPNPQRNDDGDIHPYLKMTYLAYAHTDPKVESQKAITPVHLAYLYCRDIEDGFDQHIANLYNGAFFSVCGSCKYSETKGRQKGNIVTICNIAI